MLSLGRHTTFWALSLLTAALPYIARAGDPAKDLQDSLYGKHFVLVDYPADRIVHAHLKGEALEFAAPKLRAFTDFVPVKVQLKENQVRIEGTSRVIVHDSKTGRMALAAALRHVLVVIDSDGPPSDTALSKLPGLLFFPDLPTAVKSLPPEIQKYTLKGPQHTDGASAADPHLHPPRLLKAADPEFSEEARQGRISGFCEFELYLDESGRISSVWLTRPVGYGLDENGEKAVESYQFQPATRDGVPVATTIFIVVNFQIH